MSTGNMSLDILLDELKDSVLAGNSPEDSMRAIKKRFPSVTDKRRIFIPWWLVQCRLHQKRIPHWC